MKKSISLLFLFIAILSAKADRTFTFSQINSYCVETGMNNYVYNKIIMTVGDNYIIHNVFGRYNAQYRNNDGSITYTPVQFRGGIQPQCILMSQDLSRMEERIQTNLGYSTYSTINTYANSGEDGGQQANAWANTQSAINHGSDSRSSHSHSDSGSCSSCGGTGVNPSPNSGGSLQSWVAYYNSQGTKCPYCGRYTRHYHDKCARCNTPRR